MAARLKNSETERLVLENGLLSGEGLAQYRAVVDSDSSLTLYDLLVAEGVIPYDLQVQVENWLREREAQGAQAPRALPQAEAAQAAQAAAVAATPTPATPRRRGRRSFDDDEAAPPVQAEPAAVSTPPSPPPPKPQAHPPAPARHPPAEQPAPAPEPAADHEEHGVQCSGRPYAPGSASGPGSLQEYLLKARKLGASDIHLSVGLPPLVRVYGDLRPLEEGHAALTQDATVGLIQQALTEEQWHRFDASGDLDLCYEFPGGGRYRANALRQRNGDDLAARIIGDKIFTLEEAGLPVQAKRLTEFAQGLVLVTGPSGHGKTSTMMALVELVNLHRPDHIITVEEPIEYIVAGKKCHVSQREVGPHTKSFASALRAALRENPDIIVIGELRDYETTSMAINAAETGHLVFASLPTQDAAKTIDKVLDYFPPEEQTQIRLMVSESLRGVLSQQLIKKKDGSGRVAAVELLFNSIAVGNIIREANTAGLVNAMQLGKQVGMVLMDDSLIDLVNKGAIAGEDAWLRASNKLKFKQFEPKKEGQPAAPAPAAAPGPAKPPAPPGPARPPAPPRR